MDRDVLLEEMISEMTHRAEEESDPRFVAPNVCGFLINLGHPNRVFIRVQRLDGLRMEVQLVTENDH